MTPSFHVIVVLLTLVGAMVAFVRERFSPDVTALLVLLVLVITGVLTPEEGFRGFSHPATISVAAVLVLSAALERSGAFEVLARRVLAGIGRSETLFTVVLMLTVGVLSAFINNTAAVAIFLPIVIETCRRTGARPGRLLLPMSYAAMFGGLSTLIGTSTNLLVHEYARDVGLEGFRMFEFARLGVPLFAIGMLYMLVVGRWLLPEGAPVASPEDRFELSRYVVDLFVEPQSVWVGRRADPARFHRDYDLDLIEVWRGDAALRRSEPWPRLMAGDRLRVHGPLHQVMRLAERDGLRFHRPDAVPGDRPPATAPKADDATVLAEVILLPEHPAVGHTLETARFRGIPRARILGMRRAGHPPEAHLAGMILRAGDALLLEVAPSQLEALREDATLLVIGASPKPRRTPRRFWVSLAVLAGVVTTAALGILPIVTAASAGCLVLMMSGALHPREAYESINWQIVFMLAGILALGTAMEKSGIALAMARGITHLGYGLNPTLTLSAFFIVGSLLTQFMSNAAAAALLVPVALDCAKLLGVHPEPFLIAVAFAASTSFVTPVGYQTNLMVYGPGGYRFMDFVRVGLPLNLLFWAIITWGIPRFWPL